MKRIKQLSNIVLVEPAGTINIGSVARLCENFGINELRLVAPRCDHLDPEAKKMAVKGKNLLEKSKIYESLVEAISDCPRVIATCGRKDHGDIPLCLPQKALNWVCNSSQETPFSIVFGREDHGLTNKELLLCNKVITLETNPHYPSLNLSHAVAIVLHELNNLKRFKHVTEKKDLHNPAKANQLEGFLNDSKDLLLEIGFLMEHTSNARINKLNKLLQRAEVREEELAMLRGIVSQIKWAINGKNIR